MQLSNRDSAMEANVQQVRERLKQHLRGSPTYLSMPRAQQLELYTEMLQRGLETLRSPGHNGMARGLAEEDDLDPTRFGDIPGLTEQYLDAVDFPQFVRDLITGTYGSIVESTIQQMDAYSTMYKQLAKPLGAIARDISETDALDQVATDDPLRFTMTEGGITDSQTGMEVDTSNDEIQKLVFEAKLKLAKERRLLLRETMLMGVQRLVVSEGTIRAGLIFDVRSKEQFGGRQKRTDITQTGKRGGGSFFGLFGGGTSNRETSISVSSRELKTDTEIAAKITGHVEVKFKSDYFRLDNFAELFGDEETKEIAAQRQGAGGQVTGPRAPVAAPAA